jgi:hypothetical protein
MTSYLILASIKFSSAARIDRASVPTREQNTLDYKSCTFLLHGLKIIDLYLINANVIDLLIAHSHQSPYANYDSFHTTFVL